MFRLVNRWVNQYIHFSQHEWSFSFSDLNFTLFVSVSCCWNHLLGSKPGCPSGHPPFWVGSMVGSIGLKPQNLSVDASTCHYLMCWIILYRSLYSWVAEYRVPKNIRFTVFFFFVTFRNGLVKFGGGRIHFQTSKLQILSVIYSMNYPHDSWFIANVSSKSLIFYGCMMLYAWISNKSHIFVGYTSIFDGWTLKSPDPSAERNGCWVASCAPTLPCSRSKAQGPRGALKFHDDATNRKWTNPTYPIYHQGYNPLTKWDEPPSINHYES